MISFLNVNVDVYVTTFPFSVVPGFGFLVFGRAFGLAYVNVLLLVVRLANSVFCERIYPLFSVFPSTSTTLSNLDIGLYFDLFVGFGCGWCAVVLVSRRKDTDRNWDAGVKIQLGGRLCCKP